MQVDHRGGVSVGVIGIDTPETVSSSVPVEGAGQAASKAARKSRRAVGLAGVRPDADRGPVRSPARPPRGPRCRRLRSSSDPAPPAVTSKGGLTVEPHRRRRPGNEQPPRSTHPDGREGECEVLRSWARADGHAVSDRGRIPRPSSRHTATLEQLTPLGAGPLRRHAARRPPAVDARLTQARARHQDRRQDPQVLLRSAGAAGALVRRDAARPGRSAPARSGRSDSAPGVARPWDE